LPAVIESPSAETTIVMCASLPIRANILQSH
jgi:hypothetical protein